MAPNCSCKVPYQLIFVIVPTVPKIISAVPIKAKILYWFLKLYLRFYVITHFRTLILSRRRPCK